MLGADAERPRAIKPSRMIFTTSVCFLVSVHFLFGMNGPVNEKPGSPAVRQLGVRSDGSGCVHLHMGSSS